MLLSIIARYSWLLALSPTCFSLCALSLDPEQKDQLIEVIEKLLADKTTVGFSSFLLVNSIFYSPDYTQRLQIQVWKSHSAENKELLCTADCIERTSWFQSLSFV